MENSEATVKSCKNISKNTTSSKISKQHAELSKKGSKRKNIEIRHVNCHSIRKKLDDIKDKLLNKNADVLCITESWIDSSIKDEEVNIEGYHIYRHDRPEGNYAFGGGSCIYIRKEYKVTRLKHETCEDIQDVWLKVQISKNKSFIFRNVASI